MLTGDFWGGFLGSRSSHLVPSHHRWRTCAQVHDHLMQYLVPPLPLFEFLLPPSFPSDFTVQPDFPCPGQATEQFVRGRPEAQFSHPREGIPGLRT